MSKDILQEKLEEILIKHNVDYMIAVLEGESINAINIKYLEPNLLLKYFTSKPIGDYCNFGKAVDEFKCFLNIDLCAKTLYSSSSSLESIAESRGVSFVDKVEILVQTFHKDGKISRGRFLDNKTRRGFVAEICNNFGRLSSQDCESIAQSIVESSLLHAETRDFYFRKNSGQPAGALYYKNVNTNRVSPVLKSKQLTEIKEISASVKAVLSDAAYQEIEKSTEFTQSFDAARYFTGSIAEFKEAFIITQKVRLHDSHSCSDSQQVINFFGKWPQYRSIEGAKLIQWDFNYLYPGKIYAINKDTWSNFKLALHEIALGTLNHVKGKDSLIQLSHLSPDSISFEYELLRLLPKLLKSSVELKYKTQLQVPDSSSPAKKKRKSVKKITELEQMDAWLRHFHTAEQALEYIKVKKNSYTDIEGNYKFQLIISLIGPTLEDSEIFIFFDNFQFKVDSLSQAFDTGFQMFFVFNSHYTIECENCWKLIQYYFFRIIEEGRSIPANVIDLRIQLDDITNKF